MPPVADWLEQHCVARHLVFVLSAAEPGLLTKKTFSFSVHTELTASGP